MEKTMPRNFMFVIVLSFFSFFLFLQNGLAQEKPLEKVSLCKKEYPIGLGFI